MELSCFFCEKEFKRAMQLTWEVIGFDILDISPDHVIEQDDLISAVIDYIDAYGQLNKNQLEQWHKLSYEEKTNLGKQVFTSKVYGM